MKSLFLALLIGALAALPCAARDSSHVDGLTTSLIRAGLRPVVLDAAMSSFQRHQDLLKNREVVGIIDYSLPATTPRFYVYHAATGRTEVLLVSHGEGSDPNRDGIATRFGSEIGSHMTALGPYMTAETYQGRHGLSLRLDGLASSNANARQRYIVIHGADYVDAATGRVGESWGCPAVELARAPELIHAIKGGAFLFLHGEQAAPGRSPFSLALQH